MEIKTQICYYKYSFQALMLEVQKQLQRVFSDQFWLFKVNNAWELPKQKMFSYDTLPQGSYSISGFYWKWRYVWSKM